MHLIQRVWYLKPFEFVSGLIWFDFFETFFLSKRKSKAFEREEGVGEGYCNL